MYLVFAYNDYYPSGGWNDYQFSCDNIDELNRRIKHNIEYDQYEIFNCSYDRLTVMYVVDNDFESATDVSELITG